MLCLTRKLGESIVIADVVTVTINQIRAGKVSLSIDAPREIPVHRKEIQNRVDRDKQSGK